MLIGNEWDAVLVAFILGITVFIGWLVSFKENE